MKTMAEIRKIGEFVQQVDIRNSELSVTRLLGVTLAKQFIPSVANLNGVDLSTYKVIRKNQFGAKFMSVARDGILPVALYLDETPSIISSAYYVFEVSKPKLLLPEYLMLWLRRTEFDRELWFFSGGDVRGGVTWQDFCDVRIVVPSFEEQSRIVRENGILHSRQTYLKRAIETIEDYCDALYFKYFPKEAVGTEGSSTMVSVDFFANLKAGGDKPAVFSETKTKQCCVPVFSNSVENEGLFGYTDKAVIEKESITITARGINVGRCFLRRCPFVPIVRLIVITPKDSRYTLYLYHFFKNLNIEGDGSAQSQYTIPQLKQERIPIPDDVLINKFNQEAILLFEYKDYCTKELSIIQQLMDASLKLL